MALGQWRQGVRGKTKRQLGSQQNARQRARGRPGLGRQAFSRNLIVACVQRPSSRSIQLGRSDRLVHLPTGSRHTSNDLGLRFCLYWGSLMRSVAQIARLSAGRSRWHAHQTLPPTARRIALRPGRRARGAMHLARRLDTESGRSWKARVNRFPTAVPMRSPPYEARASPRPRSRVTQVVTFRVDQVLRRHTPCADGTGRARRNELELRSLVSRSPKKKDSRDRLFALPFDVVALRM
jgi:hypothetical protein